MCLREEIANRHGLEAIVGEGKETVIWTTAISLSISRSERSILSSSRGSPARLSRVGMEGPKISVSKIPVRIPRRAKDRAKFASPEETRLALQVLYSIEDKSHLL